MNVGYIREDWIEDGRRDGCLEEREGWEDGKNRAGLME